MEKFRAVNLECKKMYNSNFKVKKVLFLGYDNTQTKLIEALKKAGCIVDHSKNVFHKYDYDLVVSFGYTFILSKDVILKFPCPIINLHMSYLPFNRGAHPNFWSHYDQTPSGVTIHLIDGGIDTGPIIAQRKFNFNLKTFTFRQTYFQLKDEIEILFLENLENLLNGSWKARPQKGKGTFHYKRDLPKQFIGWDENISIEISRLKRLKG